MIWEYRVRQIGFKDASKARGELDEAGQDGWELVTIFPNTPGLDEAWGMAIYKRPKNRAD